MNYQIIVDEQEMKNFIANVLPDHGPDEMYYVCLFARKKYCKNVKSVKTDKAQLKRFTASKDRLLQKIRQLECPLGSYIQGDDESEPVPQEALALYISPNPRDLEKATLDGALELLKHVRNRNRGINPHATVMSVIQTTSSSKHWVAFDIDSKAPHVIDQVNQALESQDCRTIVETRGGYHVLVNPRKVPKHLEKLWYARMEKLSDPSHGGGHMLPFPGTYQGGFVPRVLNC